MIGVTFLKFARAVDDLLKQPIGESGKLVSSAIEQTNESGNTSFTNTKGLSSGQSEEEAVKTVAANLTEAVTQSSSEKIVEVAKTIKEFVAENNLYQSDEDLNETASKLQSSKEPQDAAQVIKNTVALLATKTVQEINEVKSSINSINSSPHKEKADFGKENKIALITEGLAEKLQVKVAENSLKSSNSLLKPIAAHSISYDFGETEDFWKSVEEAKPSEITHFEAVSYLYDYMTDRSLLNVFNPKLDREERVEMFTSIMDSASDLATEEIVVGQLSHDHEYFQETMFNDSEHDFSQRDEMRNQEARRQVELLNHLNRLERRKLSNEMIAERTKFNLENQG